MIIARYFLVGGASAAVDFSDPYYFFNQAIIALSGNPIVGATSVEALKGYRLGAQTATTSLETILTMPAHGRGAA
jgi:polar amino acid transport system substrate-binding protein